MASLLSMHPLPHNPLLRRRCSSVHPPRRTPLRSTSLVRPIRLAVSVDDTIPAEEAQPSVSTDDITKSSLSGCKTCGRAEVERGCNGEGRIQGGIATVPGFGWWPIKAYRPCPGFVESGGRYRRQGQSMDEVAFGRGERGDSFQNSEDEKRKRKYPGRLKG